VGFAGKVDELSSKELAWTEDLFRFLASDPDIVRAAGRLL
jgi:hypothetical protein